MSRYRIWIITGLALLSWLLVFAVAAAIWNGISGSRGPVPDAATKAPAHPRDPLKWPG